MLPEISLDTEGFAHIRQEMLQMISSLYPAWTDYNVHDPGITILELLAWLKEIQQYHMDQVSAAQLDQYLKLLGQKRRGRREARALLSLSSERAVNVPRGSRFFAGGFCFETEEALSLPSAKLLLCACEEGGRWTFADERQLAFSGQFAFRPFGEEARLGSCFYLGLAAPLAMGERTALYVRVKQSDAQRRNPVDPSLPALSELRFSYYSADGWQELSLERDETCGFLQDGFLVFSCTVPMQQTALGNVSVYVLRAELVGFGCTLAPVLTGLDFASVPAVQRMTRARMLLAKTEQSALGTVIRAQRLGALTEAEVWLRFGEYFVPCKAERQNEEELCFLYRGKDKADAPDAAFVLAFDRDFEKARWLLEADGFPSQRIALPVKKLLTEPFEILVEDAEEKGRFRLWERVENFHGSKAEDCHYVLDAEEGMLLFGDGFCGMMPEGRVLLAACASSEGADGNINRTLFAAQEYPDLSAKSMEDARGGCNPERHEEAFRRFEKALDARTQAVTLADYETLAMRTPGLLLKSCRAIPNKEGGITVTAMPYTERGDGVLRAEAARCMRVWLEKSRMIGTSIQVKSPEYIRVSVAAQLYFRPEYRDGVEQVEKAVRAFFSELHGKMGSALSYRALKGVLDRLPCVARTEALRVEGRGSGFVYTEHGDLVPPPDGVLLLVSLECTALER